MTEAYGLSRNRDDNGNIVKRNCKPYVNCIHEHIGHSFDTMQVLIVELYDESDPIPRHD